MVAVAKPNGEKTASENLANQGIASYAPMYGYVRKVRGRKVKRIAYVFAPYMFVELVPEWRKVINTRGISNLLLAGESPAQIKPGWIEELRLREKDGLVELPRAYRPGEIVQVKDGVMRDRFGLYQGMTRDERHRVMFDGLGVVTLAVGDL